MMMASYEACNALKTVMRGHEHQKELVAARRKSLPRQAIKQNLLVIVIGVAAKLELRKTIKYSHRPRR